MAIVQASFLMHELFSKIFRMHNCFYCYKRVADEFTARVRREQKYPGTKKIARLRQLIAWSLLILFHDTSNTKIIY
jgi:hypothetical protein